MKRKHWYDSPDMDDAPVWYNGDEASAWAAGYDAAVRAFNDELAENIAKENGL